MNVSLRRLLKGVCCFILPACLVALSPKTSVALELEPGLYRNAPVGLNALGVAYSFAKGNILTDDSSVPIENAKAHMHIAAVAYAHYLNLFGNAARAEALVPYAWAHYQGDVNGHFSSEIRMDWRIPNFVLPRFCTVPRP